MSFEELLRKINEAKDVNLPFVIYRMPQVKKVKAIIQKDERLEYSKDFNASGFIMAPFDRDKKSILFADENVEKHTCLFDAEDYSPFDISKKKISSNPDHIAENRHLNLVNKGIDGIEKGKFIKTVLSRSEALDIKELDITKIFGRLMAKYQAAFVYVWYHPKVGLWAGASPELLVKTSGEKFQTMSLAGTQKYMNTIDVSWEDKEKKEQQIVTDHIVESLSDMKLEVSDTYTRKAGNLLHLCNDIKGQLVSENSLKDLIEKLHPTAAVCGFPREVVRNFILKEEGYDRSFYTGFLGELNCNNGGFDQSEKKPKQKSMSNLFVNLRCMQLEEKPKPRAIIYVGGGITLESDPLSEWRETVDKSLIMKSVIES